MYKGSNGESHPLRHTHQDKRIKSKNNFLIPFSKVMALHVCFVLNNLRRSLSAILTLKRFVGHH